MRLFKRNTVERVELELGTPVFTADNEAIGYVKRIESPLFEVDVPMSQPIWISDHHVRSANDKEVMLDFPRSRLSDFTAKAPVIETAEGTKSFEEVRNAVLSDDEQARQRERMERELAEQRQRLNG